MTSQSITFIGAGNMAQALIGGLLRAGHPATRLCAADPHPDARARLAELGLRTTADNRQAIADADVVVLAVKPQIMDEVLAQLAHNLQHDPLIISIAAGVTLAQLAGPLGAGRRLIRSMPNTPALYGRGITGMIANPATGRHDRALAEALLSTAGAVVWVESEALMDVVTAVSGSGPAYYFLLTEALIEAAEQHGLPAETAHALATHTAQGAGAMLVEAGVDAAELRHRVTSPGGTTQAALECMEHACLRDIIRQAVTAAVQRGRELGT